jgi:hypothetical protein
MTRRRRRQRLFAYPVDEHVGVNDEPMEVVGKGDGGGRERERQGWREVE